MAKEKYTNKSKVTLHGVAPGADFDMEVDKNGTPKDMCWRRRIRDAEFDSCIEKKTVLKKQKTIKKEIKED